MLQFILMELILTAPFSNLKTSHVTVYQNASQVGAKARRFKNISCYSLSTTLPVIQSASPYLKTSHVTVYHNSIFLQPTYSKFKNISCYSLSDIGSVKDFQFIIFKNISCYSLSCRAEAAV